MIVITLSFENDFKSFKVSENRKAIRVGRNQYFFYEKEFKTDFEQGSHNIIKQ